MNENNGTRWNVNDGMNNENIERDGLEKNNVNATLKSDAKVTMIRNAADPHKCDKNDEKEMKKVEENQFFSKWIKGKSLN